MAENHDEFKELYAKTHGPKETLLTEEEFKKLNLNRHSKGNYYLTPPYSNIPTWFKVSKQEGIYHIIQTSGPKIDLELNKKQQKNFFKSMEDSCIAVLTEELFNDLGMHHIKLETYTLPVGKETAWFDVKKRNDLFYVKQTEGPKLDLKELQKRNEEKDSFNQYFY